MHSLSPFAPTQAVRALTLLAPGSCAATPQLTITIAIAITHPLLTLSSSLISSSLESPRPTRIRHPHIILLCALTLHRRRRHVAPLVPPLFCVLMPRVMLARTRTASRLLARTRSLVHALAISCHPGPSCVLSARHMLLPSLHVVITLSAYPHPLSYPQVNLPWTRV